MIHIQRICKGFLAREYVEDMRRQAAKESGVLVAIRGTGTRQGRSGWYEDEEGTPVFWLVTDLEGGGQDWKDVDIPTVSEFYFVVNYDIAKTNMQTL